MEKENSVNYFVHGRRGRLDLQPSGQIGFELNNVACDPHPSHICSIPHVKEKKCDVRGHLAVFIWENDYKDATDGC